MLLYLFGALLHGVGGEKLARFGFQPAADQTSPKLPSCCG